MNISQGTLDQLFKTMSSYNPVTNTAMEKIATVLQPVGLAILAILLYVELLGYSKKFDSEEGGLTLNVYMSISIKYIIALMLILTSSTIIDAIVWIGIQAGKWINSIVEITGKDDVIPPLAKMKMWERPLPSLFRVFAYLAMFFSSWVANILIFMRSLDLYIVKAIAPIIVAFFVSEELRSITVGFFKYIMGVVLQGALLVLILGLIPILTANDFSAMLSFDGNALENAGASMVNIADYFTIIGKYAIIIFLLIGSQRKAKQFMGAM